MNDMGYMLISDDSIPFVGFDIERMLRNNPYNEDRLEPTYKILDAEIRAYDPLTQNDDRLPFGPKVIKPYGIYLAEHLEWTSEKLKNFLYWKGYPVDIAGRSAQAFKRHDVGKAGMPGEWKITEGKQNISEEQKFIRTKTHCELGIARISQLLEDSTEEFFSYEKMGFIVGGYLAKYHHERLDGSGPFGMTGKDMCPILRAATIVDTFHGKLKAGKSHDEICDEMVSDKHKGQFDGNMVADFKRFLRGMTPDPREDLFYQP